LISTYDQAYRFELFIKELPLGIDRPVKVMSISEASTI